MLFSVSPGSQAKLFISRVAVQGFLIANASRKIHMYITHVGGWREGTPMTYIPKVLSWLSS